MEANGGFATLGHLYHEVPRVPGCQWHTKTPYASIRRIVQDERFFFKIRPGLWALKDRRKEIEERFGARPSETEAVSAFSHTYFQGLVVEIGNMEGFDTFVPAQDRSKSFLNKQLGEVATLVELQPFTYDHIWRRARTVDVVWVNRRMFPHSFFEVEHTSDIQGSLLKFVELQDFSAKLNIVSDKARRTEFEGKLRCDAFTDIRQRVTFLDYDYLAGLHAKISELHQYRMAQPDQRTQRPPVNER